MDTLSERLQVVETTARELLKESDRDIYNGPDRACLWKAVNALEDAYAVMLETNEQPSNRAENSTSLS